MIEPNTEFPVIITDEKMRRCVIRRCLPKLLGCPFIRRMPCYCEVCDFAGSELYEYQHKYRAKENVIGVEEIAGPGVMRMIVNEGLPGLTCFPRTTYQIDVFLNGGSGDTDTQLQ